LYNNVGFATKELLVHALKDFKGTPIFSIADDLRIA